MQCTFSQQLYNSHQSIRVFCPRAGLWLHTHHSPLYPLLCLPSRICIQSIYYDVVYHLISTSAANLLPVYHSVLELPSAGSYFWASGPANFFSSFLSVIALLFLLLLFPAQLKFLFFCPFYTLHFLHIHISNASSRFSHSVLMSTLYHITLHSTQSTSLASSLGLFSKGPQKMILFLLKAIAILCFSSWQHQRAGEESGFGQLGPLDFTFK